MKKINWKSALVAGLSATAVMTVLMMMLGQGEMARMMGAMMLPTAGAAAQWIAGMTLHVGIGLTYGLAFAAIVAFVPFAGKNVWVTGAVYGLLLVLPAVFLSGAFFSLIGGAETPVAQNPCAPVSDANPCNPCGGDASAPFPWQSIVTHLVFGLSLAGVYRTKQS